MTVELSVLSFSHLNTFIFMMFIKLENVFLLFFLAQLRNFESFTRGYVLVCLRTGPTVVSGGITLSETFKDTLKPNLEFDK